MKRTYYRTTISVVVLSEEPISENMSLRDVMREADDGEFVAQTGDYISTEITSKQAADALYEMGSEPGFFRLDANGKHEDDSEEPTFYECGTCNCYHPATFSGDCRNDSMRFAAGELDEKYGSLGWREVNDPYGENSHDEH